MPYRIAYWLLVVTPWLWTPAHADDKAYPPKMVMSRYEVSFDFKPDATYRTETFQCIRVVRPQDIDRLSKRDLGFRPGLNTITILDAYTLSPDGKRTDVRPEHIQTHDTNDNDTGFSDEKEITVVYPKVSVGGQVCLHYQLQTIKPVLPGYAGAKVLLAPQVRLEKVEFTVHAPAHYQVLGRGLQGGLINEADGIRHYQFHFEQPNARKENSGIELLDFAPGLLVSSAKDYAEIARISWQDFKPATTPTTAIRRLAEDLTKDLNTPRDKARALYHWVNRNIRYSEITLGRGGWVPKSADAVLKDRHGDCKGMTVLMVALLASVGIDSTPTLINIDDIYQVPSVPVLYFNHVITYIPTLNLFLDATAKQTPFAVLDRQNQGKPTLLLASAEFKYTPFDSSSDAKQKSFTDMVVKENGEIKGRSVYRPTGRFEANSRSTHFRNKARTQTRVIDDILDRFNETGTGSIESPDPEDMNAVWEVKADFLLDPVANIPGPGAMRIPVGVAPGVLNQMASNRYNSAPPDRPTPCLARTVSEYTVIGFPKSVHITRLPPNVDAKDGVVSYQAIYILKADKTSVGVGRRYVLSPAKRLCSTEEEESRLRIHKVLQRDMRQQIFYE